MLLGIRIQNFGLFEDDCIGALMDEIRKAPSQSSLASEAGLDLCHPLNGMEALVGRNHSGKTMFFSFLSFVQGSVISGPAAAATASGRSGFANLLLQQEKPVIATLCFKFYHPETKEITYCEYKLVIAANQHGKPHFEEEILRLWRPGMEEPKEILSFKQGKGFILFKGEKTEGEMNDPQTSALHAYGAMKQFYFTNCTYREIGTWFFVHFSKENLHSMPEDVAPGGHKHLNSEGTNARNVLLYLKQEHPGEYKQLIARLLETIPGLHDKTEEDVLKFFKKPDMLSLFMLLLLDPNPRPLLLVEAPDEGLYHDMVDTLASEMRNFTVLNPHCQIMFTTHNPYIIENLSPDEIWVFCRGKESNGDKIDIKCAGSVPIVQELYKQGVGMGAIWYAGHFDD
ncbi:MAG: AAA family ATPase [Clostridiales bacterium]|nr:AAA family ATPase [Clostridiales bacterium]